MSDIDRIHLRDLRDYQILDTPREAALDDLTDLVAHLCETPMAWISFRDRDREWFKSRVGFEADEIPADEDFWNHLSRHRGLYLTEDASQDPHLAHHPLVTGDPRARFFAIIPLTSEEGTTFGAFGIAAPEIRGLSAEQEKGFRILSRQVAFELEARRHRAAAPASLAAVDFPDSTLKALRESEARFKAFIDDQPATAWMKDFEGRYIYANTTAKKVYARSAEELLGKTDFDFFPKDIAQKLRENDDRVRQSGETLDSIEEIPDSTGEVRHWQVWKFPFRDALGRAFVGGLGFDITARKKAEQAQRATEERYRSLVEGARDAIFAIAKDGTLSSANAGSERITGWPREKWIGKSFLPLCHPDDIATATEVMGRVLAGDTPPPFDLRVRTAKGDFIPMEFTVTPEWLGEKVNGILGIARDIRQRRQLEEQLRQMQKLDSIGRLAAGIAHDFNNILTVQQGYLSLLLLAELPADTRELLQQLNMAIDRAANLTRQLVMFSRNQIIKPQPLDLHEVAEQMTHMLARILGEDVKLELFRERNLPAVHADPGMMEQILMNLAANARDAMPEGGRLTISTESVKVSEASARANPEAQPGLFVCLKVSDTGTGVSPAILKHLFEPFFTTKEIGKGTGLGLATVHGIVKQHQGWIETESRPGDGTCFRIYLPATRKKTVSGRKPAQKDVAGGTETIFVVEDEPTVREMVRLVLEKYGFTVITCPDGAQAIQIWNEITDRIDLLLSDVIMPEGISGIDLATTLRKQKPSLKVILTSGYSPDITPDSLSHGGFIFLQKPYPPSVLIQTVRRALDQKPSPTKPPS